MANDLVEFAKDVAYQFGYYCQNKGRLCITHGGLSTLEWAFDILGWENPHPVPECECEFDGCHEHVTCGTPTKDGYKNVCGKHFREIQKGGITMDVREMAKYIDREALVEWLKRIPLKDLSDGLGLCRVIFEDDFKRAIKKIPKGIIVDVAPVRHGRWERVIPSKSAAKWSTKVSCSNCHSAGYTHHRYCPNCGAKMDGGADNG